MKKKDESSDDLIPPYLGEDLVEDPAVDLDEEDSTALNFDEDLTRVSFYSDEKDDKTSDSDDLKPLNFDDDAEKGPSDHLKEPFLTTGDQRGDYHEEQYFEEEEFLSPEEVQIRKEEDEGTLL